MEEAFLKIRTFCRGLSRGGLFMEGLFEEAFSKEAFLQGGLFGVIPSLVQLSLSLFWPESLRIRVGI